MPSFIAPQNNQYDNTNLVENTSAKDCWTEECFDRMSPDEGDSEIFDSKCFAYGFFNTAKSGLNARDDNNRSGQNRAEV